MKSLSTLCMQYAWILIAASCGGPDFLKQGSETTTTVSAIEEDSIQSMLIPGNSEVTTVIKSSDSQQLQEAELWFPPLALKRDAYFSLGIGQKLLTPYFIESLGLAKANIQKLSAVVHIHTDDPKAIAKVGFEIVSPFSNSTEHLYIIYHQYKNKKFGISKVQKPRVINGFLHFSTTLIGSYQLVKLSNPIEDKALSPWQKPSFNQPLQKIQFSLVDDRETSQKRQAEFQLTLEGFSPKECFIFEGYGPRPQNWDLMEPFELGLRVIKPISPNQEYVSVMLECFSSAGISYTSPWTSPYLIDFTQLTLEGFTEQNEPSLASIIPMGYGASEYRYNYADNEDLICKEAALGDWRGIDQTLELNFPNIKGNVSLCIQARDINGFISLSIDKYIWHQGVQGAEWEEQLGPQTFTQDQAFNFQIKATDLETTDPITYGFDSNTMTCDEFGFNPPLQIDPSTGIVSGTPTNSSVGECTIIPQTSSMGFTRSYTIDVRINNVNDLPFWTTLPQASIAIEEEQSFTLSYLAEDIDADQTPTYQLNNGTCTGFLTSTIDSATGVFEAQAIKPTSSSCIITITAQSGVDSITSDLQIQVTAKPEPIEEEELALRSYKEYVIPHSKSFIWRSEAQSQLNYIKAEKIRIDGTFKIQTQKKTLTIETNQFSGSGSIVLKNVPKDFQLILKTRNYTFHGDIKTFNSKVQLQTFDICDRGHLLTKCYINSHRTLPSNFNYQYGTIELGPKAKFRIAN